MDDCPRLTIYGRSTYEFLAAGAANVDLLASNTAKKKKQRQKKYLGVVNACIKTGNTRATLNFLL